MMVVDSRGRRHGDGCHFDVSTTSVEYRERLEESIESSERALDDGFFRYRPGRRKLDGQAPTRPGTETPWPKVVR